MQSLTSIGRFAYSLPNGRRKTDKRKTERPDDKNVQTGTCGKRRQRQQFTEGLSRLPQAGGRLLADPEMGGEPCERARRYQSVGARLHETERFHEGGVVGAGTREADGRGRCMDVIDKGSDSVNRGRETWGVFRRDTASRIDGEDEASKGSPENRRRNRTSRSDGRQRMANKPLASTSTLPALRSRGLANRTIHRSNPDKRPWVANAATNQPLRRGRLRSLRQHGSPERHNHGPTSGAGELRQCLTAVSPNWTKRTLVAIFCKELSRLELCVG